MQNQIQKLIKNSKNPKLIEEVFEFAKESYGDRKRISGENYIDHATNVALILSDMGLDQITIVAGLLHDIADTSSLSPEKKFDLKEIEKKFGQDTAKLVERVSEIKKIYYPLNIYLSGQGGIPFTGKEQKTFSKEKIENYNFGVSKIENLRKMFFAIAQDLRVILIELASRIDGLNKIDKLPEETQKLYTIETLEIFVPIANRLGLGEIKTKLEDLAFAYLYKDKFKWLQENIKEKYEERQKYLKKFIPHLKKIFTKERIHYLYINYRAKSYWSTYQKLLTHNMDFEKIHDLVALRIIVCDLASCYKALGILHKYYKPISEEINDYIAKPKINGYKSLHTTVFLEENPSAGSGQGKISEIQIRTDQMQKDAEYGVCAHWSYKEKIDLERNKELSWTKKIPEFWKTFKIDFFSDQIFTFTPKGDVIVLPKGATSIDFAYTVHSDIGNHCESAKIDGKIITLNQTLKNGDIVEIITNKKRKPSYDWLRFVKTNFAKSHIKKIILGIPVSIFSVPNFVKNKISEISEKAKKRKEEKIQIKKEKPSQIYLAGQKGMLVNVAKCCLPQPGDQVKAHLTIYRAAVLHKISCNNLQKISKKFPEKIIDASWEQS